MNPKPTEKAPVEKPGAQSVPPGTEAASPATGGGKGAAPFQEATPQEQEAFDKVVLAGMKAIYDESAHQNIMNMLKSAEPADALAQTTITLMLELEKKSNGQIPEAVILPAATELLAELATLGGTAGLFKPEEAMIVKAMQKMVYGLAETYDVSEQEVAELMRAFPQEQVSQFARHQLQFIAKKEQPKQPAQPKQPRA
jgi:hypothetical protein